jgi:OOP family OmpA-OmpF porin
VASTKAPPTEPLPEGSIGNRLETQGHATLQDLVFKTGSSELGDESFASLADLAAYLNDQPTRKVTLVGHTDAEGALDPNVALSKRRATAVMQRLLRTYGVSRAQVAADGVGYLSPVASNLTADGRAQNRRVEVILNSTN